jgi:hypothetical protein
VHLAYALPLAGLRERAGRGDSIVVEAGVEVFDGQVGRVHKETRRFSVSDTASDRVRDGNWIDEFRFDVPLASGIVAFHARIEGTEILNGWRQPLAATDSARGRLSCSALKTAFDIRPGDGAAARPRDRLVMVPNPTSAARLSDPLYLYYEIYNLRPGGSGRTEYTVSFSLRGRGAGGNVLRRVVDLFRGSDSFKISLQNERSGTEPHVSDYVGFDVRKAAPGDYVITLSVRDRVSKEQASSSTVIRLE